MTTIYTPEELDARPIGRRVADPQGNLWTHVTAWECDGILYATAPEDEDNIVDRYGPFETIPDDQAGGADPTDERFIDALTDAVLGDSDRLPLAGCVVPSVDDIAAAIHPEAFTLEGVRDIDGEDMTLEARVHARKAAERVRALLSGVSSVTGVRGLGVQA